MVGEAVVETREATCGASHKETFLRLIGHYEPALRRLASAYINQVTDREDLFQDIAPLYTAFFVAVWWLNEVYAVGRLREERAKLPSTTRLAK